MNTNNTKRNYSGTIRLIFCILFIITGVWFASACWGLCGLSSATLPCSLFCGCSLRSLALS